MSFWQDLLNGYIDGSVPEPKPNIKLGMGTLDSWKPGYIAKTWSVDKELFHGRALFGGYIAALADQALGLAAMTVLDDDTFFGTTNMSINYLSPVTGGELLIETVVIRQQAKSIYVECTFKVEGVLIAKASATQVIYQTKANPN